MRESQVERRKGEIMTRVIRLSDFTLSLINQYKEILKKSCNKSGVKFEYLVKTEQDLIQCALMTAINIKEQEKSK